ncbi:hypothetical protein [Hyphobacterium sp.]|uniref:alpha/beta hydrolase n=1 Tax=Hyphobacterium sp. TaxID=2004662 RepID=UPI003B525117
MRVFVLFLFSLTVSACADPAEDASVSETAEAAAYDGEWSGTLDTGGPQLRLLLEVAGDNAVLISLDQNQARLPLDITRQDASGFAGNVSSVGAAIDLERTGDDELSGTFAQGGATLPLTLVRGNLFAGNGEAADDFIVETAGGQLAGTLRLPAGDGPHPAILMLNGSGSQDRDANVAGQPVFAVLAEALAGRGIATLRLDDRGIGGSTAPAPASPLELAEDASAALEALRSAQGVDARCVGALGHSEGAMIAFLGADGDNPAFILSLAGQHGPMAEILYEQSEAIILASGGGQAAADRNRALQDAMFSVMRDPAVEDHAAALTAALVELGFPEAAAQQQGAMWGQDYAIAALDLDPGPAMTAYDGPVRALFGGRDLQVLAEPNRDRLLAAREGLPTEVAILEGVNHLFQSAETGLPQEYANAPHAMAPEALEAIGMAAEGLFAQSCR